MATDWTSRAREIRQRNLMPTELDAEIAALAAEAQQAGWTEREAGYTRGLTDGYAKGHAAGVAEERARCAQFIETHIVVENPTTSGAPLSVEPFAGYNWKQATLAAAIRASQE